jgi:hypothetical protein
MSALPVIVPFALDSPALTSVRISLAQESVQPQCKLMEGDEAYHDLVKELWNDAKPFIINEHDIISWPGAIRQLEKCEHPWCTFLYRAPCGWLRNGLGLVKFDPRRLPNIFAELFTTRHWRELDMQIARRLEGLGITAHVHMPAVTNLNPIVWGIPHTHETLTT